MARAELQMPWEYYVCSLCLKANWYAIWLVKQQCLEPHRHTQRELLPVAIDQTNMALVAIRPLPPHYDQFRGEFVLCYHHPACPNGGDCRFAHSEIEMDTWNIKKKLIQAHPDVCDNVGSLCDQYKYIPPPTKVCRACCDEYSAPAWLAKLSCIHPESHSTQPRVVVVCKPRDRNLVVVRPCPQGYELKVHLKPGERCQLGSGCTKGHSHQECRSWVWDLITRFYETKDAEYSMLYEKYKYPEEASESLRDVQSDTTRQNYVSKYHKLVYLDELAHSRKMTKECDGRVTVQVLVDNTIQITNMKSSAAMDYAHHNRAEVAMHLGSEVYYATASNRDYEAEALVVKFHNPHILISFIGKCRECVRADPYHRTSRGDVKVHFDIRHQYFHRLHEALSFAESEDILEKLLPTKDSFSSGPLNLQLRGRLNGFQIDREYQIKALQQMLSCNPRAPYLLLGPFGTGKSHILAAAVAVLLSQSSHRVLVCAHLNRGADGLYKSLQERIGYQKTASSVVRLVVNEDALRQLRLKKQFSAVAANDTTASELAQFQVIVSTFIAAMHIREIEERGRGEMVHFTHILIDEGAQSREPEVLGALSLAETSTRVVIVGDNKQVGPQVEVLSPMARENGLGTSIIERLFTHYKKLKGNKAPVTHVSTLLTNYRCHPSILMLASSLYYEFTLLSRSKSQAHPKTPYPVVFACSSLENGDFRNLRDENDDEATTLITRMVEFIRDWPTGGPIPTFGLLASTRQQVACLRKNFYRIRNTQSLRCVVEILPTYNIQGEEFDAVFLSTAEPTNDHGDPPNPSKSICNDYVFNTVVTRARSLVYVIGNPFLLLHKGSSSLFKVNCWQEYIQRCIQCQTLVLPTVKSDEEALRMPQLVDLLSSKVLVAEALEQATTADLGEEDFDAIVEQYIEDLQKRKEYRSAHKLVQNPKGDISWAEVGEESQSQVDEDDRGQIVWCTLDCRSHRQAKAIPNDPTKEPISIDGLGARRLAFHGDVVKIDTVRQCVLLDNETEEAICKTHFGTSFLCRVDPNNPICFLPLDRRHPKFVNLPTITRNEKEGVVCFDPKSINSSPKVSNFIPLECAVDMLFIVKFLGWRMKHPYPLGIIVGALPRGQSLSTGDLILRVSHGIPLVPPELPPSCCPLPTLVDNGQVYRDAFTIDPRGSSDHDDALSCRLIKKDSDGLAEYEIGVHIANICKYVQKGSEVDKVAFQRGCSVYRSSDNCISTMLPPEIVEHTSVTKGKLTDTFSVVARVAVNQAMTIKRIDGITLKGSQVMSALELTYLEAQSVLFSQADNPTLRNKLRRYDSRSPSDLSIKTKLKVLWNVAFFLRQSRLGLGARALVISEAETEDFPEAHTLIEEFMIWANQQVAKLLLKHFPGSTILRRQGKPNPEKLRALLEDAGPKIALSPALQCYVTRGVLPSKRVLLLRDTVDEIRGGTQSGAATDIIGALHLIQFEHLHPQIAAAHNSFRSQAQSPAEYCVSTTQDKDYWHDTLKCTEYTHFTSPIRRYIDIVIQRFLHAILMREAHRPPYDRNELEKIIVQVKGSLRNGNVYEREVKKLALAHELLNSSQEFLCFVVKVKDGKMYLKFKDLSLKIFHPDDLPIQLKNLSAFEIGPQKKPNSGPEGRGSHYQISEKPPDMFTWRAKVSSFKASAEAFLSHPQLLYTPKPSTERTAEVLLFVPDGREWKNVNWKQEKPFLADIQPHTSEILLSIWQQVQECLDQNPLVPDTRAASQALRKLCQLTDTPRPSGGDPRAATRASTPLWMYKIQQPIHLCETMKVQLAATRHKSILSSCVQLLEVGPGLRVCVQHNDTPVECFTDKPTVNASRKGYEDMLEYFQRWEQVLLAEGAISSIVDAELLLIKDVQLTWPTLSRHIGSDGHLYYQLPMTKGNLKAGVRLEIPEWFEQSSFNFFSFSAGDLLCIRYENINKATAGELRQVFHMVVSDVAYKSKPVTIYLKFVGNSSNYIPAIMANALRNPASLSCEIQLIQLSLPFKRVYRSLGLLRDGQQTSTSQKIALGLAGTTDTSLLISTIPATALSAATSLWPKRRRSRGSGLLKLNRYQKEAIQLACNDKNKFVMIQGPPGTGKSVTGAHLAYALAVKLRERSQGPGSSAVRGQGDKLKPCVMYCGPSQQSVNVVLEILTKEPSVRSSLKIIRVYSKAVERKDFAGPKSNTELFRKERTDAKCDIKYKDYALHYLIRKRNPGIRAMDAEFRRLHEANLIPSQEKRDKYRGMVRKTEGEVLESGVDIILCTCNEASSHRVTESLKPVYCIIDECAMATEPECMVPIRQAEHVILIGDHQQLQPVIQYREAAAMGLGRSLFQRYVEDVGQIPHVLRRQYRMHVELCKFPSNEFYGGKLQTDYSVGGRKNMEAHLNDFWPRGRWKPFVFCDVVGTEGESHTGQKGSARVGVESKYNVKEAQKIAEIADVLINIHNVSVQQIAAITPYSAQREEIRKQLQIRGADILVKTITESQGSEYGIVLMSTVRSKPVKDITTRGGQHKKADFGWLRANLGFITDRHQICVGITRCKYGLVIVGNKTLLSYDATWNRLIQHYQKHRCVRDGKDFP